MKRSKDELYQCICECMADGIPDDWNSAYMQVSINGNEIDSSFKYERIQGEMEQSFVPAHGFASLNAARELQHVMANDGQPWNTLIVKIFKDGSYEASIM